MKAMRRGGYPAKARPPMQRVALWIDHDEAKILDLEPGEEIAATTRPQAHVLYDRHDGSERFYRAIALALADAGEILVVGPSSAKLDFVRYVHAHDRVMQTKIVGVETLDHPTDHRLVEYVRHYFIERLHVDAGELS